MIWFALYVVGCAGLLVLWVWLMLSVRAKLERTLDQ